MDADERGEGIAVGGDGSPEEAFSHVANETRFDILRALWEARNEGEEPTGFSALRRRSGVDDSGQFNYHLDQLRPRFVRKVEGGYELTYAGQRIIGAAVSGVYTGADTEFGPLDVADCPSCGGSVTLHYEDAYANVTCEDCGMTVTNASVPPVLVAGCDPAEVPLTVSNHLLTEVQRLNRGICPLCNGRTERAVEGDQFGDSEAFADHVQVVYTCRECGSSSSGVVSMVLFDHPAVVSFFHDHGVDLHATPVWEFDWWYDTPGTVANEDPLRVDATIAFDGAELALTLDENLDVVAYERSD